MRATCERLVNKNVLYLIEQLFSSLEILFPEIAVLKNNERRQSVNSRIVPAKNPHFLSWVLSIKKKMFLLRDRLRFYGHGTFIGNP